MLYIGGGGGGGGWGGGGGRRTTYLQARGVEGSKDEVGGVQYIGLKLLPQAVGWGVRAHSLESYLPPTHLCVREWVGGKKAVGMRSWTS